MSIWKSKERGWRPINLWHRFRLWQAKRLYRRVILLEQEALSAFQRANDLTRKHAESPQKRLDLGDDD